jgi:hypothetical protein
MGLLYTYCSLKKCNVILALSEPEKISLAVGPRKFSETSGREILNNLN